MAAAHDTDGGVDVNDLNGSVSRAAVALLEPAETPGKERSDPPGPVPRVATAPRALAGAVSMSGGARERYSLISSMVLEATGNRSDQFGSVILVGLGSGMHAIGDTTAVESVAEALARARARTGPMAVFVAVPLDDAALAHLTALAAASARNAELPVLVVIGWPDKRAAITLDAASLDGRSGFRVVERLTTRNRPSTGGHPAPTRSTTAGNPAERDKPHDGDKTQGIRGGQGGSAEGEELLRQQRQPVVVQLLGPIRIVGTTQSFDNRPKLTELVVYLALHREGATAEAFATAIWPDRRVPSSTLSNRLSEARIALGVSPDRSNRLYKAGTRHFLSNEVTTDWARFDSLAARDDDPEAWREALLLVRGRPFDGMRAIQWTMIEGIVPAIESAVVELACRLAGACLDSGDPGGALWAARRAMLACPWDERLYRIVMRAADAAGNRAGVDAALRQLAVVLEADPDDPLGAVHHETADLYRELTSPRMAQRAN